MNLGLWLGAALFGGVFALFTFWRVEVVNSLAVRFIIAAFLFGTYCALVGFGTMGKKRTLSLLAQTLLGIAMACAMAALFGADAQGYGVAVLAGLLLGLMADKWVGYVTLP